MGFVWHDFGVLSEVSKDKSYVYIKNKDDRTLKMSIWNYKESAHETHDKALGFVGSPVTVRTSQNTNDWSTEIWFSDIELITIKDSHILAHKP